MGLTWVFHVSWMGWEMPTTWKDAPDGRDPSRYVTHPKQHDFQEKRSRNFSNFSAAFFEPKGTEATTIRGHEAAATHENFKFWAGLLSLGVLYQHWDWTTPFDGCTMIITGWFEGWASPGLIMCMFRTGRGWSCWTRVKHANSRFLGN